MSFMIGKEPNKAIGNVTENNSVSTENDLNAASRSLENFLSTSIRHFLSESNLSASPGLGLPFMSFRSIETSAPKSQSTGSSSLSGSTNTVQAVFSKPDIWQAIKNSDLKALAESMKITDPLLYEDKENGLPFIYAIKCGFLAGIHYIFDHIKRSYKDPQYAEQEIRKLIGATDKDGVNAAMMASANGRLDILKLFLSFFKNEDFLLSLDVAGHSLFHHAVVGGRFLVVDYLSKNLDKYRLLPFMKTANGSTALHLAAKQGYKDIVDYLIGHFRELLFERLNDGSTVLMSACRSRNASNIVSKMEIVQLLLKQDPNQLLQLSDDGETVETVIDCLDLSKNLDFDCLSLLFEQLVKMLQPDNVTVLKQRNIMLSESMLASAQRSFQVQCALLRQKVDEIFYYQQQIEDQGTQNSTSALSLQAVNTVSQLTQSEVGTFFNAIMKKDFSTVSEMLNKNPHFIYTTKDFKTPLMLAAELENNSMLSSEAENSKMTLLFLKLDKGNRVLYSRMPSGHNAVMLAAEKGHLAILKILLERDKENYLLLDVDASKGCNALLLSIRRGHLDVADFLIRHFGDLIYSTDARGRNIVHIALEAGYCNFARHLLSGYSGVFPETSRDGVSMLMLALGIAGINGNQTGLYQGIKLILQDPTAILRRNAEQQNIVEFHQSQKTDPRLLRQHLSIVLELIAKNFKSANNEVYQMMTKRIKEEERRLQFSTQSVKSKIKTAMQKIETLQKILKAPRQSSSSSSASSLERKLKKETAINSGASSMHDNEEGSDNKANLDNITGKKRSRVEAEGSVMGNLEHLPADDQMTDQLMLLSDASKRATNSFDSNTSNSCTVQRRSEPVGMASGEDIAMSDASAISSSNALPGNPTELLILNGKDEVDLQHNNLDTVSSRPAKIAKKGH